MKNGSGKHAYELDRVLHEKARLGMLTALLSQPAGLRFAELKELCALTDGNLSRHVQTLQEAGLVEVFKGFERKRPQTLVRLSEPGRTAFLAYLEELEHVLADARSGSSSKRRRPALPPGFLPAT